jgi:hypothetical protein
MDEKSLEATKKLLVLLKEPRLVSEYIRRFGLTINAKNLAEIKNPKSSEPKVSTASQALVARQAAIAAQNKANAEAMAAKTAAGKKPADAAAANSAAGRRRRRSRPNFRNAGQLPGLRPHQNRELRIARQKPANGADSASRPGLLASQGL